MRAGLLAGIHGTRQFPATVKTGLSSGGVFCFTGGLCQARAGGAGYESA
ncbi:MAG: hypothetical protein WAK82_18370 [Streptosporangiaceae bacterium]